MKSIKDYKRLLVSFIQVVLFLFVAFGGFLKRIAPPDETGSSYYVGILSFLVLIVLLIVSALARKTPGPKYRRAWTAAGIVSFILAVPSAFLYPRIMDSYTYHYPMEIPNRIYVKGQDSDLTDVAKAWIKENPLDSSPGVLARKFPAGLVWKQESIEHAKTVLLAGYASLVLSLATALFCLIEANSDLK
jgi:hypothetical protein